MTNENFITGQKSLSIPIAEDFFDKSELERILAANAVPAEAVVNITIKEDADPHLTLSWPVAIRIADDEPDEEEEEDSDDDEDGFP